MTAECQFKVVDGAWRCLSCGQSVRVRGVAAPHAMCLASAVNAGGGPTLLQKAANFATAAAQHIAAGAPMASEAEVQRRHAICTDCPHFDGKACGKCGCLINRKRTWLSKLSWADQSCPDDPPRWGPASG